MEVQEQHVTGTRLGLLEMAVGNSSTKVIWILSGLYSVLLYSINDISGRSFA
jgi:hypothetical protein